MRFVRSSLAAALVLVGAAACSSTPSPEEHASSKASAFQSRWQVDASVAKFRAIDGSLVYVLGTDGKLWRENGNSANRTMVDANVQSFQPMGANIVYVLGTDGNLWRENGDYTNRTWVDGNVLTFDPLKDLSTVYVLGTDRKLWRENGSMYNRVQVDANVLAFQAFDATTVYVLGTDNNLWNETGSLYTRYQVDGNVRSFQIIDKYSAFVLGTDDNLWNEHYSFESRYRVDANVAAFAALDQSQVLVEGTDGNLWREGFTNENRDLVDGSVKAFQAVNGGALAFVLGTDGKLWAEALGTPQCTYLFGPGANSCLNGTDGYVVAWAALMNGGCLPTIPAQTGIWIENGSNQCSSVLPAPCCTYVWSGYQGALQDPSVLCTQATTALSAIAGCGTVGIDCPPDNPHCRFKGVQGCDTCDPFPPTTTPDPDPQ